MNKLYEFSTVWADPADWDDLGSQKSFSKLTEIFLCKKTHDNFQIDFRKNDKNQKKLGSFGFKAKKENESMIKKTHGFES